MTTLDEKKRKEEDDYWDQIDAEKENGVGCRCRCDTDIPDVEGKQGSCLAGQYAPRLRDGFAFCCLLPLHIFVVLLDANLWRTQNGSTSRADGPRPNKASSIG